MSILLSDLVARLTADVPAVNSVPSSAQYTQAVKDAVQNFSRQCSREKIIALSIISGTDSYALPADFMKLISLESLSNPFGVIFSSSGLIPISENFNERSTIAGGQITFNPVPTYSLTRNLRYAAGWALTDGTTFADMTEEEASIVLVKAKAIARGYQLDAENAGGISSYSIGDESFNLSGGVDAMIKSAAKLEDQFDRLCDRYNGRLGFLA